MFPELVPACRNELCGCDLADFMQLVQNAMTVFISLATFALVFLLIYVGFLYVTSPTNPASRTKAKNVALSAVIGFVIVLGSFLIVDTIINTFAKDEFGEWKTFFGAENQECVMNDPTPGGGGAEVVTPGQLSCPGCVSVEGSGIPHKGPGLGCDLSKSREEITYCQINSGLLQKLQAFDAEFATAWQVNELWPPTVQHSNPCHNNGTCVDAGPTDKEAASLAAFFMAADEVGLYPVWEDRGLNQNREECEALRAEIEAIGATNVAIQYGVNAPPHFSIYTSPKQSGCFR